MGELQRQLDKLPQDAKLRVKLPQALVRPFAAAPSRRVRILTLASLLAVSSVAAGWLTINRLKLNHRAPATNASAVSAVDATLAEDNAKAVQIFRQQGPEAALVPLQTLLSRYPNSAVVLSNVAVVQASLGQPENAELSFLAAVQAEPGSAPILNNLAAFYLRRGEHLQASDALMDALKLGPATPSILLNLGLLNESRKEWAQAVLYYSSYLQHKETGVTYKKKVHERVRLLRSLAYSGNSAAKGANVQ